MPAAHRERIHARAEVGELSALADVERRRLRTPARRISSESIHIEASLQR